MSRDSAGEAVRDLFLFTFIAFIKEMASNEKL